MQGPRQQHCELCPSKDGAIKKTDNSGWAHVVCALYIPEVRFGNVTTMEPILLQNIPPERFHKVLFKLFYIIILTSRINFNFVKNTFKIYNTSLEIITLH